MNRIACCLCLALLATTSALASPFKVSSPNAASAPTVKVETEFKDGESKDTLTLPKVELKMPVVPNLDLAIKTSYRAIRREGRFTQSGPGDVEVLSKWSFLRVGGFAMAIEPLVSFPTGSVRRGIGQGEAGFELPLILGYKTGPWELGTEVGYTHLHHRREDDAFYLGLLVMRRVLPTLRVGTEVVLESPRAHMDAVDTHLDIGLKWNFAPRFEFQALGGTSLHTEDHQRVNKFKMALEIRF